MTNIKSNEEWAALLDQVQEENNKQLILPVVPDFVGEWVELTKEWDLNELFPLDMDNSLEGRVLEWMYDRPLNEVRDYETKLMDARNYGYTIDIETYYRLRSDNTLFEEEHNYLVYDKAHNTYKFGEKTGDNDYFRGIFTETMLKNIDETGLTREDV